jgi:ketosteroid isomerase-like protein
LGTILRIAVSRENVELLRRWFEALNARDIEGVIALSDSSGVFISALAAVEGAGAVYHGHDGLRRYFEDLADAWGDELHIEIEAFLDLGEHTLAFNVTRACGSHSGAQVTMLQAAVATWRDGLMVYIKAYVDRQEALRDLGVCEDELEPIAP